MRWWLRRPHLGRRHVRAALKSKRYTKSKEEAHVSPQCILFVSEKGSFCVRSGRRRIRASARKARTVHAPPPRIAQEKQTAQNGAARAPPSSAYPSRHTRPRAARARGGSRVHLIGAERAGRIELLDWRVARSARRGVRGLLS